ncbi:MAG TPA: hypothetical protein GXZ32_00100 [Clostridiales bacterium]|nr:hypothetical protein [Clostridiales bacterium]
MDVFLGILGFAGISIFIVLLIISIVRKESKSKWVIGILVSVLCISFGVIFSLKDYANEIREELIEVKDNLISEREDRESKEQLEEANITVANFFSSLFGENVSWKDNYIVFTIPVEGETHDEIFNNALRKNDDIIEHVPKLKLVYSSFSVNKKHIYLRLVDRNMNPVMEVHLDADDENVYGTIGKWII